MALTIHGLAADDAFGALIGGLPYNRVDLAQLSLRDDRRVLRVLVPGDAALVHPVFTWPGMGRLFLDSLGYSDYPVVMGPLIFSAFFVVLGNLIADIAVAIVDPRICLS